jgi:hypothetical protein
LTNNGAVIAGISNAAYNNLSSILSDLSSGNLGAALSGLGTLNGALTISNSGSGSNALSVVNGTNDSSNPALLAAGTVNFDAVAPAGTAADITLGDGTLDPGSAPGNGSYVLATNINFNAGSANGGNAGSINAMATAMSGQVNMFASSAFVSVQNHDLNINGMTIVQAPLREPTLWDEYGNLVVNFANISGQDVGCWNFWAGGDINATAGSAGSTLNIGQGNLTMRAGTLVTPGQGGGYDFSCSDTGGNINIGLVNLQTTGGNVLLSAMSGECNAGNIAVGNVTTSGANGTAGSCPWLYNGGDAGNICINAAGGITTGSLTANGGSGAAGDSGSCLRGGNGGDGGSINVAAKGGSVIINGSVTSQGGTGGNGGDNDGSGFCLTGGNGGRGGNGKSIDISSNCAVTLNGNVTTEGGDGGNGGQGGLLSVSDGGGYQFDYFSGNGGRGGNGGTGGCITIDANGGDLGAAGNINSTGGNGGNGGIGGQLLAQVTTAFCSLNGYSYYFAGGDGGCGGKGGSSGGINLWSDGQLTAQGNIISQGGSGGQGGAGGALTGFGLNNISRGYLYYDSGAATSMSTHCAQSLSTEIRSQLGALEATAALVDCLCMCRLLMKADILATTALETATTVAPVVVLVQSMSAPATAMSRFIASGRWVAMVATEAMAALASE